MAQIWVTGPCAIYVGLPGSPGTPVFLGHGEEGPRTREIRDFIPVRCDLAGMQAAFDLMYSSKSVEVVVDVIRYNLSVFQAVRAFPNSVANPGIDEWGSRGTLMVQEGIGTNLWLQFPYSAKASMAGLPPGLPFVGAVLVGPDESEMGLKPYKIRTMWRCIPRYDPATGRFTTYGTTWPAGIPAFPAE